MAPTPTMYKPAVSEHCVGGSHEQCKGIYLPFVNCQCGCHHVPCANGGCAHYGCEIHPPGGPSPRDEAGKVYK